MTSSAPAPKSSPAEKGRVMTKAFVRAGAALGLRLADMAAIIGVSPATMTRMRKGNFVLEPDTKAFELAALLVRLYRSLDAVAGGDAKVRMQWMQGENRALGGRPADLVKSVQGLMNGLAYLDARRAPL